MKPVILKSIQFSSIDVTTRTTWVFAEIFDAEGISEVVEITSGNNSNAVAKTIREMVNNIKGVSIPGESEPQSLLKITTKALKTDTVLATAMSALRTSVSCFQARYESLSLTEHLGGTVKHKVPLYANINRSLLGDNRSPTHFAKAAEKAVENGFTTIKCAPFDEVTSDMKLEDIIEASKTGIERVRSIRLSIGNEINILVDCHSRFTLETAPQICAELASLDVKWFEEPVAPETKSHELSQIASVIELPIAGGESGYGTPFFDKLLDKNSLEIIMPDIKFCGGVSEAIKASLSASQKGKRFSLHNPSGPVSQLLSAHVTAAASDSMSLEHAVDETDWRADIMSPPEEISDGFFWIPRGHSIGSVLNQKIIQNKGVQW